MSPPHQSTSRKFGAYFFIVALLTLGVFGFLNRAATLHGEDGIRWVEAAGGLVAGTVESAGPGDVAGIRSGDRLVAIEDAPVLDPERVKDLLWGRGGVPTSYQVVREGELQEVRVVPRHSPEENRFFYYLCVVGFLSLGAVALAVSRLPWSPWLAAHSCVLAAFYSLLVFSPSGHGGLLDWTLYWGDLAARLLLPVFLVHFVLLTAGIQKPRGVVRLGLWTLYVVAGSLIAANLYLIPCRGALSFANPPAVIAAKDRIELLFMTLGSAWAVILLFLHLWSGPPARIRWRLRWVAFASASGLLPPVLLHLLPAALRVDGGVAGELSILPLALIPLGFTAALLQARTVDLDRTLRAGVWACLETAAFLGVTLMVSWGWERAVGNREWSVLGGVVLPPAAGAAAAWLLHRPLKKLVHHLLGGTPPDVSRALSMLQTELNGEIRLESLAHAWTLRLRKLLDVTCPILCVREGDTGIFRVLNPEDTALVEAPPSSLQLNPESMEKLGGREMLLLLNEGGERDSDWVEPWRRAGLRYLFPLAVQGRINALLMVGEKADGSPLGSSELEILAAAAAQAGRAVDGARLHREIEESARREKKLRAQSQGIIEASRVGILLAASQGRISAANQAAKRILGQEDLLGKRLDQVLPRGLLLLLDQKGAGADGSPGRLGRLSRYSFGAADGRTRILNVTRAPLSGEEEAGQVYTLDDVTEVVAREKKMLSQDHLASVGLLASKIAHEVNTPLTGIASYAQMLMARMKSRLPEMDLLRRIEAQAFRAAGITSSVLNFSRSRRGESARSLEPGGLIAECLTLFEPHLKGKAIKIATERAPFLPKIRGKRGRVEQAVMNLLLNAAAALPNGGEVKVRLVQEAGMVKIEVSDDGPGIDPALLPRIFDPFFTTRPEGTGTGLGLAVVKEVLEEHGGRVEVKSVVGQGTTFALLLPVDREASQALAQGA